MEHREFGERQPTPMVFAQRTIQEAGKLILQHSPCTVERFYKGEEQKDFATQADLEAEQYIIARIQEAFPEDALLAEESGIHGRHNAEYTWIIDPLDGTDNFSRGLDTYGTMIARARGKEIQFGAMYFPVQHISLSAEKGKGVRLNNARVRPRFPNQLEAMRFCVAHPFEGQGGQEGLERLRLFLESRGCDTTSLMSSAAITLAMILGDKQAFVINRNKAWDNAPTDIILREAGFLVTDWKGESIDWTQSDQTLLAAPPSLHAQFRSFLSVDSV